MSEVIITIDGKDITREMADELLEKLRPREHFILHSRFPADPEVMRVTFEHLSGVMGHSQPFTFNLYNKAKKRMAKFLNTDINTAEVFMSLAVPGWKGGYHDITPENGKLLDFIARTMSMAKTYRIEAQLPRLKRGLDWALLEQDKKDE